MSVPLSIHFLLLTPGCPGGLPKVGLPPSHFGDETMQIWEDEYLGSPCNGPHCSHLHIGNRGSKMAREPPKAIQIRAVIMTMRIGNSKNNHS